jgi:hypothetical protein
MVAERRGLSDDKLATIVAGQRPTDLTRDEAISYDVASALVEHGVLPANPPIISHCAQIFSTLFRFIYGIESAYSPCVSSG